MKFSHMNDITLYISVEFHEMEEFMKFYKKLALFSIFCGLLTILVQLIF